MESQVEKRLFHRVSFDTRASLKVEENSCHCELLDLSLKGALLKLSQHNHATQGSVGQLSFNLGEDIEQIVMDVEIVRVVEQSIGVSCINIDIDSVSHLRRLIELNTGDSAILNRELHHLFDT